MTYSVIIEYENGSRETWDSGLSYQEAIDSIEALKQDELTAAQSGIPVMNCQYWIKIDQKV